MPIIIDELIAMLVEKEGVAAALSKEGLKKHFTSIANRFMGAKGKKLKSAFRTLTGKQELNFRKRVGDHMTGMIKKHFNLSVKSKIPIMPFSVAGHSSWIKTLSWSPILGTLSMTVKEGKRQNQAYKLPFFPRTAVEHIKSGGSPGKTIWRRYWRVIGKGKFHNKAKNVFKIKLAKKVVKVINKQVPTLKIPKAGSKGTFKKNLIIKSKIKISTIPKTGAKGIKIGIKAPKLRKY